MGACGGCGNNDPARRCINCLHDFGDGARSPPMTDHAELIARLQLVLDLLDAEASRLRAENEKMRKALASLEPVSWTVVSSTART